VIAIAVISRFVKDFSIVLSKSIPKITNSIGSDMLNVRRGKSGTGIKG
jgi:hypothetical protein